MDKIAYRQLIKLEKKRKKMRKMLATGKEKVAKWARALLEAKATREIHESDLGIVPK